jgi:PAS domain-containing protein
MQRHDPRDVDRVKADAAAYVAGASTDYEDEHRMLHKDGSIRWFLARGRLIVGPGSAAASSARHGRHRPQMGSDALREVEGAIGPCCSRCPT